MPVFLWGDDWPQLTTRVDRIGLFLETDELCPKAKSNGTVVLSTKQYTTQGSWLIHVYNA